LEPLNQDVFTEVDRPDASSGANIQAGLRVRDRREVEVAFEAKLKDVMLKVF